MAEAFTTPTQHQAYQNLPKLDTPFIEANGQINIVWYRLLITLWFKSGGSFTQQQLSESLQSNSDGTTSIISNTTGSDMGTVVTTTVIPPAIIDSILALATPVDQGRPQISPMLPPIDQLHINSNSPTPMDQLNVANLVNNSLLLGHPY